MHGESFMSSCFKFSLINSLNRFVRSTVVITQLKQQISKRWYQLAAHWLHGNVLTRKKDLLDICCFSCVTLQDDLNCQVFCNNICCSIHLVTIGAELHARRRRRCRCCFWGSYGHCTSRDVLSCGSGGCVVCVPVATIATCEYGLNAADNGVYARLVSWLISLNPLRNWGTPGISLWDGLL